MGPSKKAVEERPQEANLVPGMKPGQVRGPDGRILKAEVPDPADVDLLEEYERILTTKAAEDTYNLQKSLRQQYKKDFTRFVATLVKLRAERRGPGSGAPGATDVGSEKALAVLDRVLGELKQ